MNDIDEKFPEVQKGKFNEREDDYILLITIYK